MIKFKLMMTVWQVWDVFTTGDLDQIQRRMTTGSLPPDNMSSLGLSR